MKKIYFFFLFASPTILLFFVEKVSGNAGEIVNKREFSPCLNYLPILKKRVLEEKKLDTQLNIQGKFSHSHNNFTGFSPPYRAEDSWQNMKLTFWLDPLQRIGTFMTFLNSFTTKKDFYWQNYFQFSVGLEYLPFHRNPSYQFLQSFRFFATYIHRFYKNPFDIGLEFSKNVGPYEHARKIYDHLLPENYDTQFGFDYYKDNIFEKNDWNYILWVNFAWYQNNFANCKAQNMNAVQYENNRLINTGIFRPKSYNACVLKSDMKIGKTFNIACGFLFPHLSTQLMFVPKYDERFYENYIRLGCGLRYYPFGNVFYDDDFLKKICKNFYCFGKCEKNFWLKKDFQNIDVRNEMEKIEDYDFNFGIAFSMAFYGKKF